MSRPLLLDAFSCAGIGADGYVAAGFDVVCLDIDEKALKHNPHEKVHGNALKLLEDRGFMRQFDAVHASPPCQAYSATRKLADAQGKGRGRAVDLLDPVRFSLVRAFVPYVIENVERSPLRHLSPVRLCGSSFGLKVQRHRLFKSNMDLGQPPACDHTRFDVDPVSGKPRPWGVYYAKGDSIPSGGRTCLTDDHAHACMGVDRRVPWRFLCEALPPAYTEWVGRRLLAAMGEQAA